MRNSVVKNLTFCLTQGSNLNSLSTTQGNEGVVYLGHRRLTARVMLGVAMVALGACAALDPRSPEEKVAERARARWDALLKKDIKGAYEYLSPAKRSTMTLERYGGTITPGFWKSATVGAVKCESAQVCSVETTIEYQFKGERMSTPFKEKWINDGSNWWYTLN